MSRLVLKVKNAKGTPRRLPLHEALGMKPGSASPRGSTYYKTFQHCPREFFIRYVLQWIPLLPSDALTIGLLWHLCLELYYRAMQRHQHKTPVQPTNPAWLWGGCNEGAAEAYALLDRLTEVEGYAEIAGFVRIMLNHYFEAFDRVDKIRILAVEETLEYWSDDPYTCRADLIVEDYERGGMFFWEHKSAAALTEDLLAAYDMDLQILGEWWLIATVVDKDAYPPLRGVVVNIMTKPRSLDPKTSLKAHRHLVNPSPGHVQAFEHTIGTRNIMLEAAERAGWPKYLGNCAGAARGYSKCPCYDLCQQHPTFTAEQLKRADVRKFAGYTLAAEAHDDDADS